MAHDPKYIERLVYKFKNGDINADELQVLIGWYNSHDDTKATVLSSDESAHRIKTRILDGLRLKIEKDRTPSHSRFYIPKSYRIAAAAALLILVGVWTGRTYLHRETDPPASVNTVIQPGGNKATLILADGRKIALLSSQEGIVIDDGIRYSDGTSLEEYNILQNHTHQRKEQLELQTPRGGTYKITLPDSTQVWLNAATTLRYPSSFADEQRVVELIGEAYFDVRPAYRKDGSKIPFKVITDQQEVEVIGTQFNISAYPKSASNKTTLVEGRVLLKDNLKQFILNPGDQASTAAGNTVLRKVQTKTFSAWRDGKFSFDGKSFQEIMTEIGRWYDLTIVYEGKIPTDELVGDAFRNQNLGLVLRVLDVAEIDYRLDVANRKLFIKGKKNHT